MDHPTCDLYINFLGIQARSQACLYTEKIQVILEINNDIVLKSIIFVLILNEHFRSPLKSVIWLPIAN